MSPQKITWADPPKGRTRRDDVEAFAAELRKQRGKWAVYPWSEGLSPATIRSRSSDINRGRRTAPAAFRVGYEARTDNGVLYVRFVGKK